MAFKTRCEILAGDFLFEFDVEFYGELGDPHDFRDAGYVEDFSFTLTGAADEEGPRDFTPVEIVEREFGWLFGEDKFKTVEDLAWETMEREARMAYEDSCEGC